MFSRYHCTVLARPCSKAHLRHEPGVARDLVAAQGVATIVPGAIRDAGDERAWRADDLQHAVDDFDVRQMTGAGDVVDLAVAAALEHREDRAAVVVDIQPVAHLQTVTVDRQRLALQGVRDHERNQLLGELIRPVVVRRAGDDDRQS